MPLQTQALTHRGHKLPPHYTLAEQVLVAGVLKDGDDVFPLLVTIGFTSESLYHSVHRLVYETAFDLWNTFRECGPADVLMNLGRRGLDAELGPRPAHWLAEVTFTPPTFKNIESWWCEQATPPNVSLFVGAPIAAAQLVMWLAKRRSTIHAATELLSDAYTGTLSPTDERIVFLTQRLAEIRSESQSRAAA